MFFKKNDFIEFTNRIMKKSQIPILIHHKQWKQLFLNNMNKNMEDLGEELEKLVKEESQLRKKLRDYQYKKRILMNKIIHLSNRLNVKGEQIDIVHMENSRNEILVLNEEINKIHEDLEEYVEKIKNINMELLKETVKIAYSEIDKAEIRMETISNEIDLLREKLGEYWDEKETLEKKTQALYSLLHSVVGLKEIEKLDEEFFKNRKKDN